LNQAAGLARGLVEFMDSRFVERDN